MIIVESLLIVCRQDLSTKLKKRETGLELATACLEGRVSRNRRSLALDWLYKPVYMGRLI